MTTSGSSGRKGAVRLRPPGLVAASPRSGSCATARWPASCPRLPRRRVAFVGGGAPSAHEPARPARRSSALHRMLCALGVDDAAAEAGRRAQRVPARSSCSSTRRSAVLLAEEQLRGPAADRAARRSRRERAVHAADGRAHRRRRSACGRSTSTRRPRACGARRATSRAGIHLFEDMTIVENVDEDGRPVPDGERGARLLVTNLYNRVPAADPPRDLPTSSRSTPTPCACGRTLRRMTRSDGRADDVLCLPGRDGARSRCTRCSSTSSPRTARCASSRSSSR